MDRDFPPGSDSDPTAPVRDSQAESSTVPMMPPSINIGTVLKERYRIVRELSRGGFGRVFLAHDQQLHNRPVVIKIKLDHAIEDPWFERKFSEELRALTLIDHPGVVGALDSGRTPDGKPYLVMQYIEGATLRNILTPEGLPLDRVAGVVRQIGQALGAAHDKKIWHRDLKPENIMLQTLPGGDEHVKLIDFSIATIADLEKKDTGTRIAGSLPYMAPEQISGRPSAATDVYAFGVIAYEMLTGRKPFTPDDASQLASQQRDGVRLKPSTLRPAISGTAERLILRSLSYNPNDRPANARVFGDDLSHSLLAAEIARQTQSQHAKPRSRRLWVPVAALAVALGLAGIWSYHGQRAPAPLGPPKQTVTTDPPRESAAPKADSSSTDQVELGFWNSISTSTDPRLYREYLAKYPHGKFANLAKLKLELASSKPTNPLQSTDIAAAPTVNSPKLPASRSTAPPGFTAIFNGKDLSGWRGRQADYSPHAEALLSKEELAAKQIQWNSERDLHWTVDSANGEIVCDGKGVHLATAKDYSDFELYVDWLINHNGDSGIYLRSYPQVQIWDPDNPRQVAAQRGSGALWNNRPDNPGKWPLVKADNPVGHWNTFHIKMVGARVWVWLNGKQTVDGQILDNSYDRSLPLVSKGAIELQASGSEIHFRNIYIHEIPAGHASSGPSPDSLKPALLAGATKLNPKDGLTYVWIPPGTFQMGCSPGHSKCTAEERPMHQVTITPVLDGPNRGNTGSVHVRERVGLGGRLVLVLSAGQRDRPASHFKPDVPVATERRLDLQ